MKYEQIKQKRYNKINIKEIKTVSNIKVSTDKTKARDDYRALKAQHNDKIQELKDKIKGNKSDIKKHKLLKKQARITYKLNKIKG